MNNDEIRELIAAKGITVENVTEQEIIRLHNILSEALKVSNCFDGEFRMNPITDYYYLRCSSHYFDDREAVSFNRDGFIGMAGWADSTNIVPIREAVIEWANSYGEQPDWSLRCVSEDVNKRWQENLELMNKMEAEIYRLNALSEKLLGRNR